MNMMNNNYKWLIPAMLLIASCQVTKKYERPALPASTNYRSVNISDTISIASLPWRTFFTDTVLQELIAEGIRSNLDLKIAYQRIVSSRTGLWRSKQAFLPELNGTLGIKQSKLPFPQGFGLVKDATQFDIGLQTNWEADIWGKLGSAKKAAYAELIATQEAQRAILTQLVAEIANNYIYLLSLDSQLNLLQKTVINRKEDVVTVEALYSSNIVNGAAVVQSKANHAAAKVAIPEIKKQIFETENAICVLLNREQGNVERGSLANFSLPETLQTGVPSALLQNRPDVKQAEQLLRSSFQQTNVARTSFYPTLRIMGGSGFSSFDFKNWFSASSLFANIAGGLTQPILARGENKARLQVAASEQEIALYNFQKTLVIAGKEVSNALFAIQTANDTQIERTAQVKFLEQSVEFTKELLRYNSSTNYTDVLTSENNLLNAQSGNIEDKVRKLQGIISLYKALGGGWR
jgi:multidrug efflux system outer membrane protein